MLEYILQAFFHLPYTEREVVVKRFELYLEVVTRKAGSSKFSIMCLSRPYNFES